VQIPGGLFRGAIVVEPDIPFATNFSVFADNFSVFAESVSVFAENVSVYARWGFIH
jgi:hypothetical protein